MVEETPEPTALDPETTAADVAETMSDSGVGQPTGSSSSIAEWAGPTTTGMVGRAEAKSKEEYEAYDGELTAGTDPLQDNVFDAAAELDVPTDEMGTGGYQEEEFTGEVVDRYMNPYLEGAMNPQLEEARRQAGITAAENSNRFAGAYGGSAQALFDAESNRNMEQGLAAITGEGYKNAYDNALAQYNVSQDRGSVNQDKINTYGKTALETGAALGGLRRDIEQEGIDADKEQFEEEKDFDYKQIQFLHSILNGLPITAQDYSYSAPSDLSEFLSGVGGIQALWDLLNPNDVGGGPGRANVGDEAEGEAPPEGEGETSEETPNDSATGGLIGLAAGGPIGYAPGGSIPNDPMSNAGTSIGAPAMNQRNIDPFAMNQTNNMPPPASTGAPSPVSPSPVSPPQINNAGISQWGQNAQPINNSPYAQPVNNPSYSQPGDNGLGALYNLFGTGGRV